MPISNARRRELYRTNSEWREKHKKRSRDWWKLHPRKASSTQNKEACRTYRMKHPERVKENRRKWREKIMNGFIARVHEYFPSLVCSFCGLKDNSFVGISFHETRGQPHEYSNILKRYRYILDHHEDFASVCNKHHKKVHWLMKKGLSWGNIVKALGGEKIFEEKKPKKPDEEEEEKDDEEETGDDEEE